MSVCAGCVLILVVGEACPKAHTSATAAAALGRGASGTLHMWPLLPRTPPKNIHNSAGLVEQGH